MLIKKKWSILELNILLMKKSFFILFVCSVTLSCKNDSSKGEQAGSVETVTNPQVKKPTGAIAEKLYVNYYTNPSSQAEKDQNALIDYAVENDLNVERTKSGLYYIIEQKGTGPNLIMGQPTKAHYTGHFLDGRVFDSSRNKGVPMFFNVGQMIPGWNEALQFINVGTKIKLLIPSRLAYADRGFPGYVPPNTPLIFDIEILPIM